MKIKKKKKKKKMLGVRGGREAGPGWGGRGAVDHRWRGAGTGWRKVGWVEVMD